MKQRYTVIDTVDRAVGLTPYYSDYCDSGIPRTYGSYDAPASPAVPLTSLKESLDGGTGRKQPHGVRHRKMIVKVNDPGPLYAFGSIAGLGPNVTTYPSLSGYRAADNLWYMRNMVTWPVLTGEGDLTAFPVDWTVTYPSLNENSLKNDLYSRANGLQADILLDLVEGNQVWPSLTQLTSCIPQMARNWTQLRKVIRTASGAYLAWKFGVSPILGDVSAIWKYMPKMASDIARHADGQASRYSIFKKGNASYTDRSEVERSLNGYPSTTLQWQGRSSIPPVIGYVLVVRPQVKYLSGLFQALDRAMSRFATGPASLVWEHLPWTFVADWFVDLRGLLMRFDDTLRVPPYKIQSFTRSEKYVLESDQFVTLHSPCSGAVLSNVGTGSVSYSHYVRSLVPQGYGSPTWNPRFGKTQCGISAALILQKLSAANR